MIEPLFYFLYYSQYSLTKSNQINIFAEDELPLDWNCYDESDVCSVSFNNKNP